LEDSVQHSNAGDSSASNSSADSAESNEAANKPAEAKGTSKPVQKPVESKDGQENTPPKAVKPSSSIGFQFVFRSGTQRQAQSYSEACLAGNGYEFRTCVRGFAWSACLLA